ncbi:MAG: TVP38/TMEM64 family protein, partial [Actinobacteria bacterium]|nr:TVP38/TMEM64 family protein [Actinomycetota bacterium]
MAVVRRVSALVVVIVIVAVVVMLNQAISASDVEAFLVERGWLGPVVFVVTMWILQPLLLPGPVFMVPASLVWS